MKLVMHQTRKPDWCQADLNALRIIPDGADKPGLPMPDTVEYTPDDLERMAALWDSINPAAAGLLQSPVINRRSDAQ